MNSKINVQTINNICSIDQFYKDAVIFISGGTGFLGKLLVEKLLRSFAIKRIYLLIRTKNKINVEKRLENLFKETVFDQLRLKSPESFKKVVAVYVNFDTNDLCIPNEYRSKIFNETQIVFNIVASVKFNEELWNAACINISGTNKILKLALKMKNLQAFLHISTIYSNCNRNVIEERVYEQCIGYEKIVKFIRFVNRTDLLKIGKYLLNELPNTYTVTKKCSENLVNHKAYCLPAGIFRPPIVLSTYKEPVPGWTDNLYGPSGLCVGTVRGFIHAIYGHPNKKANLVPADYCVNAMIAAAWDSNRRYLLRMHGHTEIPVYNFIFDENNLTWGQYMLLVKHGLHEPLDNALWYYSYYIIPSKILFAIANTIFHRIPGFCMDICARFARKDQIYSRCYQKLNRIILMMSYFGLREWTICNNNISNLSKMLCDGDKQKLEFNLKTVNWKEYFYFYMPGIKTYYFKENDGNIEKSKRHYNRLKLTHILIKSIGWILLSATTSSIIWKLVLKIILA